jgi:hypothetical protein
MNVISDNEHEFKSILRAHNSAKHQSNNIDLYIHLTDWFGIDTSELKHQLAGLHLKKKDELHDYCDDADDTDDNDDEDKYESNFLVYAFGLDENGNSVSIKITDFKPYFFIKVPDTWRPFEAEILVENLKKKAYPDKFKRALFDHKLIKAKPYYGFTANDQFNFLKLIFYDYTGFRRWSYMFKKNISIYGLNNNRPYKYELYESNIDPMIRLTHIKEISPSGWVRLPANKYNIIKNNLLKQTRSQLEVEIIYKHLQSVPERNQIQPLIVAAYDIEADSSHGDFPIAKKDYQKLAQDIMTEYTQLVSNRDSMVISDPRGLIHRWLQLAFEDLYQNYNISRIVTESNELPSHFTLNDIAPKILTICQEYIIVSRITDPSPRTHPLTEQLHSLFEHTLPIIDFEVEPNSHYGLLASQICKEYVSLHNRNTNILLRDPLGWIKYIIILAFDTHYNAHNINRVYTKQNIKPEPDTLHNMVPMIYNICQDCVEFLETKRREKKAKTSGKKSSRTFASRDDNNDNDNAGDVITQDAFVERLRMFLNEYLPPVEGDITIQIGTTYQRYGDPHPFLKHIITLGSCESISATKLIQDEHKNIIFPDRELEGGLRKLYKQLQSTADPSAAIDLIQVLHDMFDDNLSTAPLKIDNLEPIVRKQLNSLLLDNRCQVQLLGGSISCCSRDIRNRTRSSLSLD